MRFLIADEQSIFRTGLRQILLEEFPSAMVEEANDAETVIQRSLAGKLDLITCDLSMPGKTGLDLVKCIQNFSTSPVLVISTYPEGQYSLQALRAGAAGYLSKDITIEELRSAVSGILQGRKYISAAVAEKLSEESCGSNSDKKLHEFLSPRELDIFKALAEGKPTDMIAKQFALGASTIRTHRSRIMVKMNMKSNAELMRYAIGNKLIG